MYLIISIPLVLQLCPREADHDVPSWEKPHALRGSPHLATAGGNQAGGPSQRLQQDPQQKALVTGGVNFVLGDKFKWNDVSDRLSFYHCATLHIL